MYKKEYFSDPLLLGVIFNDFENVKNIDEIGSIFRWAANELMYDLLYSYVPKETKQI